MRGLIGGLCLLAVLAAGGPAGAVIGTIDDVPASTLLLPYFEVDLADSHGVNTIFTVNLAGAIAVLARVTVWSDLSVPVLGFNVYLTGYDSQVVDMRQVLQGNLPRTASDGQDPNDTISPQGEFSQDINFASCFVLPYPKIPSTQLKGIRAALTGKFSSVHGGCAGLPSGNIARGYVTVDTVNACTTLSPADPGYFGAGGAGTATNQNILWGDYVFVSRKEKTARGDTLVHIESSSTDPETTTSGQYTFYGRYVNWTAADNREPLATNFAVRYTDDEPFDDGTRLVVWRDSKVVQGPFACDTRPAWFPLAQESILAFDEQENPWALAASSRPFPAETQRVKVGSKQLPLPFDKGWLFLNLNTTEPTGDFPPEDPGAAQAWVSVEHYGGKRHWGSPYSVGYRAIQLDSATAASHVSAPVFPPQPPNP
jgi:hypothetical protein